MDKILYMFMLQSPMMLKSNIPKMSFLYYLKSLESISLFKVVVRA